MSLLALLAYLERDYTRVCARACTGGCARLCVCVYVSIFFCQQPKNCKNTPKLLIYKVNSVGKSVGNSANSHVNILI